jgi:hypothetical protein
MNDLSMLDEIGVELDPPVVEPPDRLRGRVLSGVAGQPRRGVFGALAVRWRRVKGWRLGWRLATAGGLAVALTAGVIAAQTLDIGDHAPAANAEAATILRNAAQAARRHPELKARPDQFVYIESIGRAPETIVDEKGERTVPGVPGLRRAWLSVDSSRDGLVRQRPQSGGAWTEDRIDDPSPAYLSGLPTDKEGMRRYIASITHGGDPRDIRALATIGDLIRERYVAPRSMAALLEVAAEIEGTIVVRNVVDMAGRGGIAVATNARGVLAELIFDPETYEYLGEQGVAIQDVDIWHKGDVTGGAARLRIAIVDRAGELPR